jgi:hypothetical protein
MHKRFHRRVKNLTQAGNRFFSESFADVISSFEWELTRD